MSEQRMSRKELHRPDRIQQALYAISNFIFIKKKWFIAGGIALIVAVIAVFLGIQYYQIQQIEQANLLYAAQRILTEDGLENAEPRALNAFNEFYEKYPDSGNGAVALMHIGKLYVEQNQWEQAEQAYRRATKHTKAAVSLVNAAKVSLAVIYEGQQKWDAANEVINSIEGEDWRDVRWKYLAQIALAQRDINTAKDYLERLVERTPDSLFRQEAQTILLTLNP